MRCPSAVRAATLPLPPPLPRPDASSPFAPDARLNVLSATFALTPVSRASHSVYRYDDEHHSGVVSRVG